MAAWTILIIWLLTTLVCCACAFPHGEEALDSSEVRALAISRGGSQMLKNTLILPEGDARLAAKLAHEAINALDVILMFIFGKDAVAKQAVEWADQLCNKASVSESFNMRRVVWVRDTSSASVREVLHPVLGNPPYPLAAVLNFHDEKRGEILEGGEVTPIKLERLFLKGHTV